MATHSDRNSIDGDRSDLVEAVLGLKSDVLEGRIPLGEAGKYSTADELIRSATPEACGRLASTIWKFADAAPDGDYPAVIFLALVGDLATALSARRLWDEASRLFAGMADGFARHIPDSLAEIMIDHAEALAGAGRLDQALGRQEQAETILVRGGDHGGIAKCRRGRATILGELGRYGEAWAASEDAGDLDLGVRILTDGVSEKRISRGDAQELVQGIRLDRLPPSRAFSDVGTSIREKSAGRTAGDGPVIILASLGFQLARAVLGKIDEDVSSSLVGACDDAYARHAGIELSGMMRLEWAKALWKLGRYTDSLTWSERAESALSGEGAEEDYAEYLRVKAAMLRDLGQYPESVAALEHAERLLAGLDLPDKLAACWRDRGGVLLLIPRYEEAFEVLMKAENAYAGLDMPEDAAMCRGNRAIGLLKVGRLAEGHAALADAETVMAAQGHARGAAVFKMQRAQAALDLGRPAEAIALYREIDRSELGDESLANYHEQLAEAYYAAGQPSRGLEEFAHFHRLSRRARHAAGIDETSLDYVGRRKASIEKAVRLAIEAGQVREGYDAALNGKASVFGDIRDRSLSAAQPQSAPLVERRKDLADWLMLDARSPVDPELIRPETEARVRSYLEAFRAASPARPSSRDDPGAAIGVEEIQAALPPDWGLLDFWRTDRQTVRVFVLTRSDFQLRTLHVPFEEEPLRSRLMTLARCIDAGSPVGSDEALDDLYHYLFAPLQPLIAGLRGMYLVPHGKLHIVPLHACRRYEGGRCVYLGDDYEIAYLPSARLLPSLPPLDTAGGILSLANPDLGSPQTLPFSDWEAKTIRRSFPDRPGRYYIGPDASVERTRDWGSASILHFSCHGTGDEDQAAISRLFLADDVLLAHDVLHRRPPLSEGSLVILNGCETGRSDFRSLDDAMGMMTTFLLRGAGLVLSTMWSVDDHCAAEMVACFLDELLRNQASPSLALRRAQARVRGLRPEDLSHRERQLLASFPREEYPHEAASIHRRAAMRCLSSGRHREAADHGRQAADALRFAGDPDAAEAILRLATGPSRGRPREDDYNHPIYWSAFQLIGRVT